MHELKFFALSVAVFGAITDLLTKRIPNWWTFSAMLLGIVVNTYLFGFAGLTESLGGLSLGFICFFPIYYFGHMGGGDVKLLMAIGSIGGIYFCIKVMIASILIGAVYAIFDLLLVGRLGKVVRSLYRFFYTINVRFLAVEKPEINKDRKFSFGIALAMACALVIVAKNNSWTY